MIGNHCDVVDLVQNDDPFDNQDLIESDSEEEEFQLRRKRGIPSRTSEIIARLRKFYEDVEANTGISLDLSSPLGRKKRSILTFHLSMICRSERKEDRVKCFISYAKACEMFCNVLLGAGLMELEPAAGHVICHPDTGIRFCRMAAMFKGKRDVKPTEEQVQSLARSLTERIIDSDSSIDHIFLPIDLQECHWGLLIIRTLQQEDGREERVLWFGDSLRFTCPLYYKKFLQAVIDRCLPPPPGSTWRYERANYILDSLGYEKQQGVYSCGPYVISAVAETARTRGCMPKRTFSAGYDPSLTEKYRWGCVEARLRNIFRATIGNGLLQSTEFLVHEHMLRKRKYFYQCRHRSHSQKQKPQPSKGNREGQRKYKKRDKNKLALVTRKTKMRRVTFQDSVAAVTSVLDSIINAVVNTPRRPSKGDKSRSNIRTVSSVRNDRNGDEEEEIRYDFPRTLYDITMKGHSYGVHYCRPSVNKRRKQYLTVRLRCLKYLAPLKCKAAMIANLLADRRTWKIKYKPEHNHGPAELSDAEVRKRVETVCGSILFEISRDDREELRPRFALSTHDKRASEDATTRELVREPETLQGSAEIRESSLVLPPKPENVPVQLVGTVVQRPEREKHRKTFGIFPR